MSGNLFRDDDDGHRVAKREPSTCREVDIIDGHYQLGAWLRGVSDIDEGSCGQHNSLTAALEKGAAHTRRRFERSFESVAVVDGQSRGYDNVGIVVAGHDVECTRQAFTEAAGEFVLGRAGRAFAYFRKICYDFVPETGFAFLGRRSGYDLSAVCRQVIEFDVAALSVIFVPSADDAAQIADRSAGMQFDTVYAVTAAFDLADAVCVGIDGY